jgi:hypothetical protein
MTPLGEVPSTPNEIARLYHELASLGGRVEGKRLPWRFGKPAPEETLVLAAQAARYDPRLLWVLVELLARDYGRFDPLKLRRHTQRARWPATLGVAFEFARRAAPSSEIDDVAAFVMKPIRPGRGERFFLQTRAFAGKLARRDAEESLAEYKRWGYLSREEPIAKELGAVSTGTLGRAERMNLLRRIVERNRSIALADYLAALRGRASRRQASRDLAAASFLARTGSTRGTQYRLIESPAKKH